MPSSDDGSFERALEAEDDIAREEAGEQGAEESA